MHRLSCVSLLLDSLYYIRARSYSKVRFRLIIYQCPLPLPYHQNVGVFTFCLLAPIIPALILISPAIAQLQPDNTLGEENSVVTVVTPDINIKGIESDRIDGEAQRGPNLFHSFQEFNIQQGRGVYFTNPNGVTNILTLVTGNNGSNILGTLGVDGKADL